MKKFKKDLQYYKFCSYGFLKNLRFFEPFLIIIFRYTGFSFFQIGILYSIKEISTNLFEIPTGIIADSYGRRISMVFSFLAYIISLLIFYFFPNYTFYILAMVLFAVGEAFRTGTHKAMILEYLKIKNMRDLKVEYYGSTRSCSQLGSALSSILAAVIVFFNKNYRLIFIFTIIPYVIELFLMLSYPKELDGEIKKFKSESILKNFIKNISETLKNFAEIIKNPSLIKIMLNSSLFDAYFKTVKDYIQPIIKSMVLSTTILIALSSSKRVAILIGGIYFIIYILTSIASRNAGNIVKQLKSMKKSMNTTFIISILFILISGLFYIKKIYIATIIIFIIYYMLQNLRRPIAIGYISELIKSKVMATGLSVESQLKTLLIAVLSPILGFFVDKFNNIGIGLIIFSGIAFSTYFFTRIKETKTAN